MAAKKQASSPKETLHNARTILKALDAVHEQSLGEKPPMPEQKPAIRSPKPAPKTAKAKQTQKARPRATVGATDTQM